MTEDRIRAAAQQFREDVVRAVDVELAYEQSRRPGTSPSPAGVALAVLAVVVLVAAAFLFRPDNGDVEVAVDEEETTTTRPDVTLPDDARAPAPISLGAPDDGTESVGLPVTADPSTDLIDGQVVTVTGSGFPPGVDVGVVMCTREAGADHGGRGVDACNIGHFAQGRTDDQGTVTVVFSVRRIATLDGEEIDCASEAGRCILGMGMLSDYDQSGGVAIDFDPSVPLPPPPTITLSEYENIADGEVVAATITGLLPNSYLLAQQCADQGAPAGEGTHGMRCAMVGEMTADGDGTFDGGIRLWRNFGTYMFPADDRAPNVDCVQEECVLRIEAETPGNRRLAPVGIRFDPDRGARVPPTMTLVDPGPFTDGDTIELRVEDLPASTHVEASICSSTGDAFTRCYAHGSAQYDGSGTLGLRIQAEPGGQRDCADDCYLLMSMYGTTRDGQSTYAPPPLLPDPIPISITP